ncbi:MAG TPA: hypothetical protein VLR26_10935 [Frankiaceae bacterium]|nr:hypothetical protein [Frankiaceae bacterium]
MGDGSEPNGSRDRRKTHDPDAAPAPTPAHRRTRGESMDLLLLPLHDLL